MHPFWPIFRLVNTQKSAFSRKTVYHFRYIEMCAFFFLFVFDTFRYPSHSFDIFVFHHCCWRFNCCYFCFCCCYYHSRYFSFHSSISQRNSVWSILWTNLFSRSCLCKLCFIIIFAFFFFVFFTFLLLLLLLNCMEYNIIFLSLAQNHTYIFNIPFTNTFSFCWLSSYRICVNRMKAHVHAKRWWRRENERKKKKNTSTTQRISTPIIITRSGDEMIRSVLNVRDIMTTLGITRKCSNETRAHLLYVISDSILACDWTELFAIFFFSILLCICVSGISAMTTDDGFISHFSSNFVSSFVVGVALKGEISINVNNKWI